MALQFNPPQDLINAYLQRPSPGQIASEGINQALQTYSSEQDKQKQEQNAALKAYVDAFGSGGPELANSVAAKMGLKNPPALPSAQPPAPSTGTPGGFDVNASTPTEMNAQQSLPAEHPPLSPIVQASINAGHPTHPDLATKGYQLPTPEQMATWQGQGAFGQKKIAEAKNALEMNKTVQGMQPPPPDPVFTKETGLAAGSVPHNARIVEPAAPKDAANSPEAKLADKQIKDAQAAYNSDKNREKADAVVEKVSQAVPLLKAGTIDNATAKQALQTAMTYMATGGMRVNEVELKQFGGANALTNKMAQWFQGIDKGTLTPRDAKDMGAVLEIFQKSAHKNLQDIGLRHTHQYLSRSKSGQQESDAYKTVTGTDYVTDPAYGGDNLDSTATSEGGYTYTPGTGGRANQANWKKQ